MSGKARATGRIRALTLAAVVLAATTGALPNTSQDAQAAPLAAGSDFTITSTISSSATSATGPALLYPGVTRYLWYTVHNPLTAPITVTSLGISNVQAPSSCSTANLDLGDPTFAGAVVVPALRSLTVPVPKPIRLIDLPDVNQDGCKNVTFAFTFTGTGWYSDNPPVTRKIGTATVVVTSPNPAPVGAPVTLTARVVPTSNLATTTGESGLGAGTPTGTVTFHLTASSGTKSLLGMGALGADGSTRLRLTTLPPGAGTVHAVYGGTATHEASTSQTASVSIIGPPPQCKAKYTRSIIGRPGSPVITGTRGNDFIYAVGATYRIKAGSGNDCVVVGLGNNIIDAGYGADVVIAGNGRNAVTTMGSWDLIIVGNGAGNRVTVKGAKKGRKVLPTIRTVVIVGNGTSNRVTIGSGSKNRVTVGNGASNRVTVGKGSTNRISVGHGTANRITVGKGAGNRITVGNGAKNLITLRGTKNKVILGKGKKNRVVVRTSSKPRTTCYLPTPPRTWRGKPVRYYRDTFIRCRVVTR